MDHQVPIDNEVVTDIVDQPGSAALKLSRPANRIVSLVPSQTELLFDLGLDKEVVGITKFCVHPHRWQSEKVIVGGTKKINHDIVNKLRPDLIIANKEENTKSDILQLREKYPVWVSNVGTLKDAYEMITAVGELTGRSPQAATLTDEIRNGFNSLPSFKIKRALYVIWKKPWMTAGTDTFIDAMMKIAGFENLISEPRYPKLTDEQIQLLQPEVVLLSSEPFPFKPEHVSEMKQIVPSAEIRLVDGEMFSWYGSRMKLFPAYLKSFWGF